MNAAEQVEVENRSFNASEALHLIKQYKVLTNVIKDCETELKLYKNALEKIAIDMPGMAFELEGYTVRLLECQRESISVKDAKAALGEVIAPFVKMSNYSMLKVN